MALATRAEHTALEARLSRTEQAVFQADAAIKVIQAHVQGGQHGGGRRVRSRTPPPLGHMGLPPPRAIVGGGARRGPPGPMQMLNFSRENQLDEKCVEALQSQHPEVQWAVLDMGVAEGRNPSAMIIGRIAKCAAEVGVSPVRASAKHDVQVQVLDFITGNNLDDKVASALQNQSLECQLAVISQGPAEGRNPSAMVTGRVKAFIKGDLQGNPSAHARQGNRQVEEFIAENGLDDKVADLLRNESFECQMAVINKGPAEGRNPSAMVVGRIRNCGGGHQQSVQANDPVEEFISENRLDSSVAESLRNESVECQTAVLDQGPAAGRNPSAMVAARIKKFKQTSWA